MVMAVADEGGQKRQRQGREIAVEDEASTGDFPKVGLGQAIVSKLLPASNGPAVNAEDRGKLTDSPR